MTDDQLELLPPAAPLAPSEPVVLERVPGVGEAVVDPIARVLVDVPLAHLDRPFDYTVLEKFSESVRPGVRVKVRFAGQGGATDSSWSASATSEHTWVVCSRCGGWSAPSRC